MAGLKSNSATAAHCLFGKCLSNTQLELTVQFIALTIAAGIGVGLTCINFFYVGYEGDSTDIGSWGSYFTTYATLFAIISGMVLVNVLERFQQLEAVLEDELNAIESIRDSLVYLHLDADVRISFFRTLLGYLKSIAGVEWELMSQQDQKDAPMIDSDTNIELLAIHTFAAHILHKKENNGVTVNLIESLIIPLILDLGKLRTRRLSLAQAQLPPRLKFLLLWMIFFLVIGFILMSVENLFVNIFMTVAVSGAIQWLYTIISDLDHPYYGMWNLSTEQLDKLVQKFEAEIGDGTIKLAEHPCKP